MRSAIKIILLVLIGHTIKAQQVGMYAHYFYKPMVYNPAFAGNGEGTDLMLINRTQWAGITGSPQLNILNADGNLANKKAGLGVTLISDRKGITRRISGNVSYSYKVMFNEETYLAFGLALGVVDHTVDFSKAAIEDPTDPTLFFNPQRKTAMDGNAGFAFIWKGLEIGAAVPQIIGNKISYVENTDTRTYYMNTRHIMGSLKYKFFFSKEKGISLAPQALVRFVPNSPLQYDANLNFDWKNKFWIGGTYKSNYAIGVNAGINIHKQIAVGYSYDVITGNIGKYAGISHEIMLNYRFGKSNREDDEKLKDAERKMDTLQTQLNELKDKVTSKEEESSENERKIQELSKQLQDSKNKQKELNDKVEQLKKTQSEIANNQYQNQGGQYQNQGQNQYQNQNQNQNQNKTVIEQNKNKVMEDNILVMTNSANDFKDAKNHMPKKGFYVIAGTFIYQDFAQAEAKRLASSGYKNANWVYFPGKQYNYVYLYRVNTKEEAVEKVKAAKAKGINDAWIQVLVQ